MKPENAQERRKGRMVFALLYIVSTIAIIIITSAFLHPSPSSNTQKNAESITNSTPGIISRTEVDTLKWKNELDVKDKQIAALTTRLKSGLNNSGNELAGLRTELDKKDKRLAELEKQLSDLQKRPASDNSKDAERVKYLSLALTSQVNQTNALATSNRVLQSNIDALKQQLNRKQAQ